MPSYYYTKFQKNPCVGRNERCPLAPKELKEMSTLSWKTTPSNSFCLPNEKGSTLKGKWKRNDHSIKRVW